MAQASFVSYAQNSQDVVLARALRGVDHGRYLDVGAHEPMQSSVSYAFYERGWAGIAVEPVTEFAEQLRSHRPRDLVVEAAATGVDGSTSTLHQICGTGLSTLRDDVAAHHRAAGRSVDDVTVTTRRLDGILAEAGWGGSEIHFAVLSVEGAEEEVLRGVDLQLWRPWIFVVAATRPPTSEPSDSAWEALLLDAGYRCCLFDGLSRFYVSVERWDELAEALSVPANYSDDFISYRHAQAVEQRDRALAEMAEHDAANLAAILEWRSTAVAAWAHAADATDLDRELELQRQIGQHVNHIQFVDAQFSAERAELEALQQTFSWRITKPLRGVRTLIRRGGT